MARYRKGDRVVVRDDLVLNNWYWMRNEDGSLGYHRYAFTEEMKQYSGRVVTIRVSAGAYIVDDSERLWTDDMFVGLEDEVLGIQVEVDPDALDSILK